MGNRNIPKIIFKASTRFTKKNYFHILFCDRNFRLVGRLGSFEMNKVKPFSVNNMVLSRKIIIETLLNVISFRSRLFFKPFFLHSAYNVFIKKNGIGKIFSKIIVSKNKDEYKVF